MEDALWAQGIRKKGNLKKNRYEFQTDHGFRKWFKTRCEISGMKSINIEILMGHSVGISDSYYKVTEEELLQDYVKAIDHLTISNENQLQKEFKNILQQNTENEQRLEKKLIEKEKEFESLYQKTVTNEDVIASLSDQLYNIMRELERLKEQVKFEQ